MTTAKTLREVRDVLTSMRFSATHDYEASAGGIYALGLYDSDIQSVLHNIGVGWKAIEVKRVPTEEGGDAWVRINIVPDDGSFLDEGEVVR